MHSRIWRRRASSTVDSSGRMKMNFFKRLAEKVCQPFRKTKPEVSPIIGEESEIDAGTEDALVTEEKDAIVAATEDILPEADTVNAPGNCMKQAQCFLFKEGKPIGKPFGRRSEIRIVYVNNFVESFLFFLRLCDQRLLDCRRVGGHLNCTAVFPDGNGRLTFTDKVSCRNKAVIAILKIEMSGLQPQLSEIRFEIKHKND